jgi:protein involved in sex pheromone biosynthesis
MKQKLKILILASLVFITGCAGSKQTASAAGSNDGSSYEKAIVVNSVSEEYAYVKKVCPGCKFKKQSLSSKNKKYYDILIFIDSGSEVMYYFDINSFFGKGF